MPQSSQQTTDNWGKSSILKKISPSLRRHLDRSIIERDPPTYREIFAFFQLPEMGVSFTAFYRYARRIRLEFEFIHNAALAFPDDLNVHTILPDLIAARLLEIINDPDNPPRSSTILQLTQAHKSATQTLLALRRLKICTDPTVSNHPQEITAPAEPQALPPDPPDNSILDRIVDEVLYPRNNQ
ncbi:MAG: hypothetical protein ACE5EQ_05330 [Phycisphaerae bacterium]